jgi:hypothetical protein
MSAPARRPFGRGLAGAAAVLALTVALAVAPVGAQDAADEGDASLELVGQTLGVDPGGALALAVRPGGLPAGAQLRLVLHDRARSRSELARANDGDGLRATLHTETVSLAAVPVDANGHPRLTLDLAPTAPAGPVASRAGVYPVEVDALDARGRRLAGFVTHLVVRPAPAEGGPPLDVALLARLGGAPAAPSGPPLGDGELADAQALVTALLAVPDVAATLAVSPDLVAGLAAEEDEGAAALLDGLQAVAAGRPLLALPYVRTSPDALAEAGLSGELAHQLDRGIAVVADVLGALPSESAWLATDDLGTAGLQLLDALGTERVLVAPGQVERLSDGVLSPARPFLVTPPRSRGREGDDEGDRARTLEALATDAHLDELLHADVAPALVASRTFADLAMLWFEQPGTPRAVVLPVDASIDGAAVRALLDGLSSATLFRPVALDDAFATALPLRGSDGETLRRALIPDDEGRIGTAVAGDVTDLRSLRGSVQRTVGADAPILDEIDSHLLRATAVGLDGAARAREVDAARAAIDGLADAVETPAEVGITLTAREGTVPLTIRNTTGAPLDVEIRLRSPKLELPGGDTFAMTLTEDTSRLDIAVRARASGSFPFEIEVTSPDGRLRLATTRYSVRSTAVSGVGLVLSAGAGLFLVVWWARHWREARRSAKLVNGSPPEPSGR